MPKLTIHRGNVSRTLTFEGAPVLGSLLGAELQRP